MKRVLGTIFLFSLFCCQGLASTSSVLLRYDDGVPDDGMWVDSSRGHAVLFTPPSSNWTLSKIAIAGRLNLESDHHLIVFEIWDENLNLLYSKADNPESYFRDETAWAEIDIPDMPLSCEFYVCLFEFSNVYVGTDLSNTSSGRSFVVSRNPNKIDTWNLPYPKNETDWSIAAFGCSSAPIIVDLILKSNDEAIFVKAAITDPDGDLTKASMQVVDKISLDALWSEQRLIGGYIANLTFTWPREFFQIANDTDIFKPVFAFNTVGISPNQSRYLAYAVPCILKLTPTGSEINAAAYFDQSGEFHALIDASGSTHYMSRELLMAIDPDILYGDYSKNNVTLIEGISSLSFLKFNFVEGMVTHPPLMLTRSQIHHYKIRLNKMEVGLGDYVIEVNAEDSVGNQVSKRAHIIDNTD